MTNKTVLFKNWEEALIGLGQSSGKVNALVTRARAAGLHGKDKKKGKENLKLIGEEMETLRDTWLEFIRLYQEEIIRANKQLASNAKAEPKPNQKPIKSKPKAKGKQI